MRLPRFLFLSMVLTTLSVLYVWQQTEIVRLAYVGQKNSTVFRDLLDKNSLLRYNLKRSTSLIHLGSKLNGSSDFKMPQSYCSVTVPVQKVTADEFRQKASPGKLLLSQLFGVKRQAEAQTIDSGMALRVQKLRYLEQR